MERFAGVSTVLDISIRYFIFILSRVRKRLWKSGLTLTLLFMKIFKQMGKLLLDFHFY